MSCTLKTIKLESVNITTPLGLRKLERGNQLSNAHPLASLCGGFRLAQRADIISVNLFRSTYFGDRNK